VAISSCCNEASAVCTEKYLSCSMYGMAWQGRAFQCIATLCNDLERLTITTMSLRCKMDGSKSRNHQGFVKQTPLPPLIQVDLVTSVCEPLTPYWTVPPYLAGPLLFSCLCVCVCVCVFVCVRCCGQTNRAALSSPFHGYAGFMADGGGWYNQSQRPLAIKSHAKIPPTAKSSCALLPQAHALGIIKRSLPPKNFRRPFSRILGSS
jgi:hypothetical protein